MRDFDLVVCTPGVPAEREFWSALVGRAAGPDGRVVAEATWPGGDVADLLADIRTLRRRHESEHLLLTARLDDETSIAVLREVYRDRLWQIDVAGNESRSGARPPGDVVVGSGDPLGCAVLDRFVRMAFCGGSGSPDMDEQSMYFAAGAALRSAAMRGQAGAAICDATGDLIAVGTNEAPKAGGGQYWTGDAVDGRDSAKFGFDFATSERRRDFDSVLDWLVDIDKLSLVEREEASSLARRRPPGVKLPRVLRGEARGRVVHAEESALLSAARRGVAVDGGRAFVTQIPCHLCLRHMVMAGVSSVRYLQCGDPSELLYRHDDAVSWNSRHADGLVSLAPFAGIAPRGYPRLFACDASRNTTMRDWSPLLEDAICEGSR
ncbi:MAG: hypothetical protein ACRDXX_21535 [Stackebrandtia sp.]